MTAEYEVRELQRTLERAVQSGYYERAAEILQRLKRVRATEPLLRATDVGKLVNKLRKHTHLSVCEEANAVYLKWKKDVGLDSEPVRPQNPEDSERAMRGAAAVDKSPSIRTTTRPSLNNGSLRVYPTKGSTSAPPSARPVDRTVGGDGFQTPWLDGSKVRMSCFELLYKSVATGTDVAGEKIMERVKDIEEALINLTRATNEKYKNKIRSLSSNIKNPKNIPLKEKIISGQITGKQLVNMTSEELAPESLQKEIKVLKAENDKMALAADIHAGRSVTSQFRCGKCKGRRCTYFQMQTRSADEPMTTFVTCMDCNNNWKI